MATKLFGTLLPPTKGVEGRFRDAEGKWAPGIELPPGPPPGPTPGQPPDAADWAAASPVLTPHGDRVRSLYGPNTTHINPKVGIAAARNALQQPTGLGLYALRPIAPGELIGIFTGVWALERDVEAAFTTDADRRCIDNYAAEHARFTISDAELFNPGGIGTTEPFPPPVTSDQALPEVSCVDVPVHGLLCLPRMSGETISPEETARGLCAVQHAPFSPNVSDVAALINAPKWGGKRTSAAVQPRPANVVAEACVAKPNDSRDPLQGDKPIARTRASRCSPAPPASRSAPSCCGTTVTRGAAAANTRRSDGTPRSIRSLRPTGGAGWASASESAWGWRSGDVGCPSNTVGRPCGASVACRRAGRCGTRSA